VAASTDGETFDRLVVVFLKRMFRCIRAAKLGALWPIREIGPNGRSLIYCPLLLLLVMGRQPVEMKKSELPIKLKLVKGPKYRQGTYNIIGNFIVRVNHALVHVSRYPE